MDLLSGQDGQTKGKDFGPQATCVTGIREIIELALELFILARRHSRALPIQLFFSDLISSLECDLHKPRDDNLL